MTAEKEQKAQAAEAKRFTRMHGKKPATEKKEPAVVEKKGKGRSADKEDLGKLFGFSMCSVIRTMGRHGFTVEEATLALGKLGIKPAKHTLAIGIRRGVNKDATRKFADLSKAQLDSLRVKVPAAKGGK